MPGSRCHYCNEGMDPTHQLWIWQMKFFCSERCCAKFVAELAHG